ncbi:hypothetical protein AAG570_010265 [Ranatra chinensis]|uniref:Nose resistant to fluoxetine protein 6 n=1 Tax=Ranatra chinensis TaxID=642074 RepID=A0ABD0YM46_9HEMI
MPSGILSGNINQYGDIDECLQAEAKYCLTYLNIKLSGTESHVLHTVHTLMHSHHAFRSTPQDPGHRVPRYSSMHWGVCVPKSCAPEDVENSLKKFADSVTQGTGLKATVQVNPEMCQVQTNEGLPYSTKFVGCLFLGLICLAAMATVYDFMDNKKDQKGLGNEILLAFSLKKNSQKLFSLDVPADDISSIHGIRLFNAVMLYFSHKSMAIFYNPYMNRTAMAEALGKPWTVIARAASLYTDPFIMMSGLLTAYSLGRQMQKHQKIDVMREIASRLLRLMPTLGGLILFCTFILPYMGSGPQWPLVINHHAEICKNHWWRNMLFIHNYFGFKNMCLTHTHHIGIDTQLFMVSPLLVYIVYRWPKQGLWTLLTIGLLSTVLRFYTSYIMQLNLVSQMFNTADYSYILPTHRASVYVMGIALGYLLRQLGRDVKLKSGHLTLGWFIAFAMLYQSMIQPSKMGSRFYVYDRMDAANYAAFAPITWCLFFSWIIFTSHTGNGGIISKLASWRGFQISTRLAYTFYLTQFPVFFYNVGRVRHTDTYSLQLLVKSFII